MPIFPAVRGQNFEHGPGHACNGPHQACPSRSASPPPIKAPKHIAVAKITKDRTPGRFVQAIFLDDEAARVRDRPAINVIDQGDHDDHAEDREAETAGWRRAGHVVLHQYSVKMRWISLRS